MSAAALLGLGALAGTACNSGTPVAAAPSAAVATPPAAAAAAWPGTGTGAGPVAGMMAAATPAPATSPVAVNCGPGQQALIRPVLVGGQAVSQVDCVPLAGAATAAYQGVPTASAAYYPDPRVVDEPVVYRRPARRVANVQDAPRVVRRTSGRSWQKSAVIIGSSAGVGAAVGGALDGKKGALIGAAIGGGGATIWDQATRRK
jgi:hypothetical protein